MNLFWLFLNVGGISPPAYKETPPWGTIITVAAFILFIAIFFTALITKHVCNSKKQESTKSNEENHSEQEQELLKEFRKLDEKQKDMLIQTAQVWNKTNEK